MSGSAAIERLALQEQGLSPQDARAQTSAEAMTAKADEWPELARAQAGDARAVEVVVRRLLPRVRNLCRYLSRGDQGVDDAAQEALIAIVRGLSTYRGEGRFEAWADRIAARAYFASRRKRETRVESVESELPPEDGSWHNHEDFAARRLLARRLDELPEAQRQALVLHHVVGMSVPEVAEVDHVSEETVRSRLRLGRQRMRRLLEASEPQAETERSRPPGWRIVK